jgi:hypothetical protein
VATPRVENEHRKSLGTLLPSLGSHHTLPKTTPLAHWNSSLEGGEDLLDAARLEVDAAIEERRAEDPVAPTQVPNMHRKPRVRPFVLRATEFQREEHMKVRVLLFVFPSPACSPCSARPGLSTPDAEAPAPARSSVGSRLQARSSSSSAAPAPSRPKQLPS